MSEPTEGYQRRRRVDRKRAEAEASAGAVQSEALKVQEHSGKSAETQTEHPRLAPVAETKAAEPVPQIAGRRVEHDRKTSGQNAQAPAEKPMTPEEPPRDRTAKTEQTGRSKRNDQPEKREKTEEPEKYTKAERTVKSERTTGQPGTRGYHPEQLAQVDTQSDRRQTAAQQPSGTRTTGPIQTQQPGIRTTGPIQVQPGVRTTGPMPAQPGIRTTGPIQAQPGVRTTGPMPAQPGVRATDPMQAQPGLRTADPVSIQQQTIWSNRLAQMQSGVYQQGYTAQEQRSMGWNQTSGFSGSPPVPPPVQQDPDPKDDGNKKGGAMKAGLLRRIAIGAAAAALLIVGGLFVSRYMAARAQEKALIEYVSSYDDLYVPGVYVDGISLEGMNAVQARAMVESNARERSNAWSVRLTYNGKQVRTITASDLSMSVDVEETLAEAWAQGHTGTIEERKAAMDSLLITPYEGYTANPSGDTSVIDTILQELSNQTYRTPSDATIASFDPNLTYPFTFNEEVIGRRLNTAELKEAIYHSLSTMESQDIELTIETIPPNVTVADIKEELVALRGTATTPISSSSAAERNENIRTAFAKISGTIIQPGQQFSFNNVVGPRTEKNGFLPAIEYAYGELSDGIGGGVCQASTTVYLAAVRAGMEIIKREPHSDAVSYIEYGKDATVYWYSNHKIDMVFKNTTASPIYITAAVQSSPTRRTNLVCVVNIYGAGMHGISYDIVTQETVIEAPTEPEYVKDKNAEYVTYTDQQKIVRKASNGCSVDSWRVTYQDGKEIDRKFMYNDVYSPKAERIYVGVTSR